MRCPRCAFDNPDGMNFCGKCGANLSVCCMQCDFANPPGFQFCGKCGASLTDQTPTPSPVQGELPTQIASPPPEPHIPDAERRQLTILFTDLVDSTKLSGQLDAEDYREIVRAYQATCAEVIERFDCHLAQTLGDGLLIYSGYPVAHDNDAERAVRAGLGILDAMKALNERLDKDKGIRLGVRVGIHTGLVVVGDVGAGSKQEQLALGEVPNIAARIQGLAQPDTVVISNATYRLVQGYFECQALGERELRGVAEPIAIYRALQESGAQSRLDVATSRGLTPLVGRESEVTLLLERWNQAKDGQGQVVLLSGEAGIGKTRIVQTLKDHVADEPHIRWECRSSPYYQNTALYPITDLLQRTLQFQSDDFPEQRLEKLEQTLSQYHLPLEETVPLFAPLLSVTIPEDHYPPLTLSPQRQRQKTLESIVAIVLELSEQQPVLFILEDLHWTDPSTLELLDLLIDQTPTASICVLLTCRPEFQPTWSHRSYLTEMTLNRLSRSQIESIATQVAGGKTLPDEVLVQLAERTDGVPLYIEEMIKSVLESGVLKEVDSQYELTGSISSLSIPSTLQDSLMARLDRLITAKGIAQQAAVIGRQFSYELLQAVSHLDEATLQLELERLVEAELVFQRGLSLQATYIFKHALVQDAAYQSLLRSTRQQYHQVIAQVLEERFAETVATQPELLAHHYTEAGQDEAAISYWQRAGQRAIERSANLEAVSHLMKGIALITQLEETPARLHQELELQTALGTALMATRGFAAPEVERTYSRAQELCQQVGETPQRFSALWGIWYFYAVWPDAQKAVELATQLITLAQRANDAALRMIAHRALGANLIGQGELAQGLAHLRQALTLYNPQQHRALAFVYGQDIGVICQQWSAWALWFLGSPDQALQMQSEALQMAHEADHPLTLVYVMTHSAYFHLFRRERERATALAEIALRLATEQGFGIFIASMKIVRGEAVAPAAIADGIAWIREGIEAWRATGAELFLPLHLTQLAEAYGHVGQAEAGLAALEEGLAIVERGGEHMWDADLYRVKGNLMLLQGAEESAAEACLHTALEIARHQGAKIYELRAAVSLSRLWQSRGKRQDAYELLAPVYGWFTEGFDTADLKDAKALLDELSEGR